MSHTVTYKVRHMSRRALVVLAAALLSPACAGLAPLREPPPAISDETIDSVATRDEAIARFGPPLEVRASDVGEVLVYQRRTVVDHNPNRFYGVSSGDQLVQYERFLLYLDADGKIVRRGVEPE